MPTLHWIGKEAVVKHHKAVPYRLLEPVAALSAGDPQSENLIVQGDNLHALKALLPRYAGQVKCIYIDPPYNTGNEGWVYNDNVNSAEIKRWLGEVVGKEGETLDRHDRWLCMMYPRLLLLKQFLREDGAIFVSIDDNEVASLRLLMDEIFGAGNFVASIAWHKRVSPANDAKYFSSDLDSILVFSKKIDLWRPNRLVMTEKQVGNYRNPDGDKRGDWNSSAYTCAKTAEERPNLYYPIKQPNTDKDIWPSKTRVWAYEKNTSAKHAEQNMIYWGANGKSEKPRLKKFLSNAKLVVPRSFWTPEDTGHNQEAKLEINEFNLLGYFATPKPSRLIQRILQIAADKDSLILDSFAGSGTTAHAVLKQNAEDGGNRRFILVEMDENIAQNVTAERVKRVAQGYRKGKNALTPALSQEEREQSAGLLDNPRPLGEGAQSAGEGKDWVTGLGGGFQFCKLSAEPLFTAHGQIRSDVTFAQLAEFVWFVETGTGFSPSPQPSPIKGEGAMLPSPRVGEGLGERGWTSPLLGVHQGRAIYLLYNGILKDKSVGGGNVLTQKVLDILPAHDGAKVIFAAANRLGAPKLAREQIVFKQTPYALDV